MVQIAAPEDIDDDATIHWPESARALRARHNRADRSPCPTISPQQQHIIFDPIPRVDGIEPSADPLLELRAAIYLLSGRERRPPLDSNRLRNQSGASCLP